MDSPDLVNCENLADSGVVVERVYELGDLNRLKGLLAHPRGMVLARFAFTKLEGRSGARVTVSATPLLVCQRCMQDFGLPVSGGSELEFSRVNEPDSAESEREPFEVQNGLVSLRELAEEELLLALPIAPKCNTPQTCGKAPAYAAGDPSGDATGAEMRRPFIALRELLKKT